MWVLSGIVDGAFILSTSICGSLIAGPRIIPGPL